MCLSKIIIISIFVVFISSGVAKIINCDSKDGSLFLSNHSTKFESAHQACKKSGGTLAQISNENFVPATDLVFQCLGPNKDTWIGSWNSDSETEDCLTLYVGHTSPGGSVAKTCSGERYALCNTNKHSNTNGTEANIDTSGSLSENEETPSDLPSSSSLDLDGVMDQESDTGTVPVSDSPYLDEKAQNLPNVWHPGDDTGMAKLDSLDPSDVSYIWGSGGDVMFGSPNDNDKNNDDTSSKVISANGDQEEGEDHNDENEEVIIEVEEMEKSLTNKNKVQKDTSWNSVEALLVDTVLIKDESDDNYVAQNA